MRFYVEQRPAKRLADWLTVLVIAAALLIYVLSNLLDRRTTTPDLTINSIEQLDQGPDLPPEPEPALDLDQI